MGGSDEAVVGVFAGVQRSHSVEFAEQDCGQEMVYRERVVWMPLQYLIELLNGAVVIEIIEVVEGLSIQRVVGAERHALLRVSCWRARLRDCNW